MIAWCQLTTPVSPLPNPSAITQLTQLAAGWRPHRERVNATRVQLCRVHSEIDLVSLVLRLLLLLMIADVVIYSRVGWDWDWC